MKGHFVVCKNDGFPTVSTKRAIPSLGQGRVARTVMLSLRSQDPLSLIDHVFGRVGGIRRSRRHLAAWFEPGLVAIWSSAAGIIFEEARGVWWRDVRAVVLLSMSYLASYNALNGGLGGVHGEQCSNLIRSRSISVRFLLLAKYTLDFNQD